MQTIESMFFFLAILINEAIEDLEANWLKGIWGSTTRCCVVWGRGASEYEVVPQGVVLFEEGGLVDGGGLFNLV